MVAALELPASTYHAPASTNVRIFQLVAVGDCNTSGLEDQRCVPSAIADWAKQRGLAMRVQNFAAAMRTSREGCAQFAEWHEPPDGVLINFGLVDAWPTSIPWFYIPVYPDKRFRRPLRRLLKAVKRRLRAPWIRRFIPVGPVVPQAEFAVNIGRMIDHARQLNPNVRIVLWGTCPTDDPRRDPLIAQYNGILEQIAVRDHIPYFDTPRLLADSERSRCYVDPVHLSEESQRRIAAAIGPLMCETSSNERR